MEKQKKEVDAVKMTREIRQELYEEIKDLNKEELKAYFDKFKEEKDFDCVKMARDIKDKMDAKFAKMTPDEIVAYFAEFRKNNPFRPKDQSS